MTRDEEIFESLLTGGVIGAALGALLSNKSEGAGIGALAGAAILATYKANEQARKTNVPLYIEQDGKLYELQPGGGKKFIRNIQKQGNKLPSHFRLK
jgi:hypothetical protein